MSKNTNVTESSNKPLLDMSMLDAINALYEHDQIKANSNTPPVNVTPDRFDEVRIRLAQIDNYLIERNGTMIDPLKVDNIINMNTGKVVIKWVDFNGGIIRPQQFGYPSEGYTEDWKYFPEKDDKDPENRTLDCYNHDKASEKEMLELSHAFIWNNGSNWCGMNYLPPVGSIVIIGFKKNNLPIILGYLQTDYKSCKPYIKPGETIIKGYGNNYIHWRWSNKLDINVKCKKDELDLDDPYKQTKYKNTINMLMRFDCATENLTININRAEDKNDMIVEIRPESFKITHNKTKSSFSLSGEDIYAYIDNSKLFMRKDKISLKTGSSIMSLSNTGINVETVGTFKVNAKTFDITTNNFKSNESQTTINTNKVSIGSSNSINVNSGVITLTSSGTLSATSSGGINLSAGSTIMLKGSSVNGSAGQYNFK